MTGHERMVRRTHSAPLRTTLWTALVLAQCAVAALALRNWAYVTTYRLYLEQRADDARQSTATQRFDIEGDHVVPRIVTRGRERIAFRTAIGQDSTIHVDVRPVGRARFEIGLGDGADRRVIAQGDVLTPTTVVCAFPGGSGVVDVTSDGAIEWVDLRVVRNLHVGRHVVVLVLLLVASIALRRGEGAVVTAERRATRRLIWFRACAVVIGASSVLLLLEGALRLLGDHLPGGIATERHDLGEVGRDPRWEDSPRYGRRLRANVDAINEWRNGDIARMGYVPSATSDGVHRFPLHTDREGFRNPSTREHFDVAALGDSFTDALTMAADASWPAQLERRLDLTVQNYGTAGFGPQQELLVLEDYVAAHRPRLVVLAFFAGNDIFNAESFDEFQRAGGQGQSALPGWRIKDIVSRADTWYVVSALRATAARLGRHEATKATVPTVEPAWESPTAVVASFENGLFTVPVAGRVLHWALMPPYLNTLNFSEEVLSSRQGWRLTARTLRAMQQETHGVGAEFVVMFLPFKSQVFLPLLERTFSRDDLRSAFHFYLKDAPPPDIDAMVRNRLAQNKLMQRFCAASGIPFLDTTPFLQAQVDAGETIFFPDDAHLNEAGEAVVAEALAEFLTQTGLATRRSLPPGQPAHAP